MDATEIVGLIESGLEDATALVQGADGVHFEAVVVSPAFAGKRPLQRHQMIYATLGKRMGQEIHALSLKAYTPEEWEQARTAGGR